MASCGSCGAAIFWGVTRTGAREPIDADPVPNGNIEITQATIDDDGREQIAVRHLLKGEAESDTLFGPPPRYISHFSSCPDADKHRRKDPQ